MQLKSKIKTIMLNATKHRTKCKEQKKEEKKHEFHTSITCLQVDWPL